MRTASVTTEDSPDNNDVQKGLNIRTARDDENTLERLASLLSFLTGLEAALTVS